MKNLLRSPFVGRDFNTLAQNGTHQNPRIIQLPGLVSGKGADISNVKQMHRWAEEKLIDIRLILALVDEAKGRGDWEAVDSYWNSFHCLGSVVTADGRLYGKYCKNRICSICNGIRKANKLNSYLPVIRTWPDPFKLILTVKNPGVNNLQHTVDEMYNLLHRIIEKYRKRNQRNGSFRLVGVRSFECTYNPTDDEYHPHFHFILANRETAFVLQDEWLKLGKKTWGKKGVSQGGQCCKRIQQGKLEENLIEAVKYGTKIFTEQNPRKKKQSKKSIYIEAYYEIVNIMKGEESLTDLDLTYLSNQRKNAM